MAERCQQHGVALSPQGRCVLCARSSRPVAPAIDGQVDAASDRSLGSQLLNGLLLAGVLCALCLLVLWSMYPGATARLLGVDAVASPEVRAPSVQPARGVEPTERTQSRAETTGRAEPPAFALEAPGQTDSTNAQTDAQLAAAAERDRVRSEMVAKQIRDRELRAARGGVEVVMYSTSWCGHCRRARDFMATEGIAYTEHNVEDDPSAERRLRRLNPRGGVPTFDIDGQVLVGFSGAAVASAIDRAAQRSP